MIFRAVLQNELDFPETMLKSLKQDCYLESEKGKWGSEVLSVNMHLCAFSNRARDRKQNIQGPIHQLMAPYCHQWSETPPGAFNSGILSMYCSVGDHVRKNL